MTTILALIDNLQLSNAAVSAVTSIFTTSIVGVVIFLFSQRMTRWVFGPDLKITFSDAQPWVVVTDKHNWQPKNQANIPTPYTSKYVRLRVTNTKQRPATGCRAFLAEIKKIENGRLVDSDFQDFLQLNWSYGLQKEGGVSVKPRELTLNKDVSDFVDVVATFKDRVDRPTPQVVIQTTFLPKRYVHLIERNTAYVMTIAVVATEADTRFSKLEVVWDGTFDGLKVTEYRGP